LLPALEASPVGGGATVRLSATVADAFAASNGKVLFVSLPSDTQQPQPLIAVDPHSPAAATTVDPNVRQQIALCALRNGVVYSNDTGLFFVAVP
jgi:hypothetical protein